MRNTPLMCLFLGLFGSVPMFFPVPARAGVGVSPTSLSFGSVTVNTMSSAATVVVTNESRQSVLIHQVSSSLAEFVVSGPSLPVTLGPHASASFQVMFRPGASLTYSGSIRFNTSRENRNAPMISVSGTGTNASVPPPPTYLLSANTNSLNFGNTLLGTLSTQGVSVTNTGTGSVNISQIAITGAVFTVSGFPGAVTLASGQSFTLSVNFMPTTVGGTAGNLAVVSNATNSPATISLSGTGVQPAISVIPTGASFGNVTVGLTNTQMLTIKNPGTANLSVTQASLAGADFNLSGLIVPLSVPPGGSSAFTVSFTPASASSFSGSLTLVNNTSNSLLTVALAGTGISPVTQLSASSSSLSFGSVTTNSSATQNVTLTSTGNSSVSLSQISTSSAAFSATGLPLPLTLAAGQSTSFSVAFAPTTTGSLSGSVTITSNAANSPTTISLSGSGTAPVSDSVTLSWTPSSSSFAGFNIYRGSVSGGPYSKENPALVSTTSYTDTSVLQGRTYYYVATEVDSAGVESAYSTESVATIP